MFWSYLHDIWYFMHSTAERKRNLTGSEISPYNIGNYDLSLSLAKEKEDDSSSCWAIEFTQVRDREAVSWKLRKHQIRCVVKYPSDAFTLSVVNFTMLWYCDGFIWFNSDPNKVKCVFPMRADSKIPQSRKFPRSTSWSEVKVGDWVNCRRCWNSNKVFIASMLTTRTPPIVTLNVGGTVYQVTRKTVQRYPDSMLEKLVAENCKHEEPSAPIFIDRDGLRLSKGRQGSSPSLTGCRGPESWLHLLRNSERCQNHCRQHRIQQLDGDDHGIGGCSAQRRGCSGLETCLDQSRERTSEVC